MLLHTYSHMMFIGVNRPLVDLCYMMSQMLHQEDSKSSMCCSRERSVQLALNIYSSMCCSRERSVQLALNIY